MICPDSSKGVRMLLLSKVDDSWVEKELFLSTVQEIKEAVGVDGITQINLSRYMKIFYCLGNLERMNEPQLQAKVRDMDGDLQFMVSPILICQCDDTKPVDLSEEIEKSIKSAIDFS